MRKVIFLTAILLGLVFSSINLSAQTQEKTDKAIVKTEQQATNGTFVDKNKNGVCDNHESKIVAKNKRQNFTDKNNDGVCDNKGTNIKRNGNGNGNCVGAGNCNGNGFKHRHGNGNGCGRNTSVGTK
jgi:hypothetical protein